MTDKDLEKGKLLQRQIKNDQTVLEWFEKHHKRQHDISSILFTYLKVTKNSDLKNKLCEVAILAIKEHLSKKIKTKKEEFESL